MAQNATIPLILTQGPSVCNYKSYFPVSAVIIAPDPYALLSLNTLGHDITPMMTNLSLMTPASSIHGAPVEAITCLAVQASGHHAYCV